MMKVGLFIVAMSLSCLAMAKDVGFSCQYEESGSVVFKFEGELDQAGGSVALNGVLVTGTSQVETKQFYRVPRKNEKSFRFAKYDIKAPEKRDEFLKTYYRLSIPKSLFKSDDEKSFVAYFGFHRVEEEDSNVLEELPAVKCKRK